MTVRLVSLETNSSNVAAHNLACPQWWNFEGKDKLWVVFTQESALDVLFYLTFSEFQKLKLSKNANNKKNPPKRIFLIVILHCDLRNGFFSRSFTFPFLFGLLFPFFIWTLLRFKFVSNSFQISFIFVSNSFEKFL